MYIIHTTSHMAMLRYRAYKLKYFYLQHPAPKNFVMSDPASFGFRNGHESPLRAHGDPDGGASAGAGAAAAPARRATGTSACPAPDVTVRPPGAGACNLPCATARRAAWPLRAAGAGQGWPPPRAPVGRCYADERANSGGCCEHDDGTDHLERI
jgi:hypothetical protein